MRNDKKVLASVDQSQYAESVANYAIWAARFLQAPLSLLHVLDRHLERSKGDDLSGMIGLDAQENLTEKLVQEESRRIATTKEQGRILLDSLRDIAGRAGIEDVEAAQRYGAFEEVLVDQTLEVRLLVLGRSGAGSAGRYRPKAAGRYISYYQGRGKVACQLTSSVSTAWLAKLVRIMIPKSNLTAMQ